jgi:hypothetical protein
MESLRELGVPCGSAVNKNVAILAVFRLDNAPIHARLGQSAGLLYPQPFSNSF